MGFTCEGCTPKGYADCTDEDALMGIPCDKMVDWVEEQYACDQLPEVRDGVILFEDDEWLHIPTQGKVTRYESTKEMVHEFFTCG
jgi:hypothetical protein